MLPIVTRDVGAGALDSAPVAPPIGRRRRMLADAFFALAAAAPTVVQRVLVDDSPRAGIAVTAVVASAAPLMWRRRFPGGVYIAALSAFTIGAIVCVVTRTDDTIWHPVPVAVAAYFVSTSAPTPRTLRLVVTATATTAVIALLNAVLGPPGYRGSSVSVMWAAALVTTVMLGSRVRAARLEASRARERAVRAFEERNDDIAAAIIDERRRLARDLHDVAAHHLSLVVMQAEALRSHRVDLSDRAIRDVDALASDARRSMDELRAALLLLREPADDASPDRSPDLRDVEALVQRAVRRGQQVSFDLRDTPDPARVGRVESVACYRIVLEGLSNARRYAPDACVAITVRREQQELIVAVVNERPALGVMSQANEPHGSGFGLVGLAERVHHAAGTVEAGPTATGGWRLCARLPITHSTERGSTWPPCEAQR
jgi:signal transduction histidine kinase